MGAILAIRGARKAYGGRAVLQGVDLEVERGEWVALLGPNGAGKTTLLHAVAGVVVLDGGNVTVGSTGLVPQDLALYESLTVRENLEVFARFHGVPHGEVGARADEALEWSGLAERQRCSVGQLSGGMKRRLNVACGLLHRPEVVLLDEPTVGVDPASRARIREELRDLTRRGTAVLHSTHEFDDVEEACDRAVVLADGRVIADGSPRRLLEEAFGGARSIVVELLEPCPGLELPSGFAIHNGVIRGVADDTADRVADLLSRIARAGGRVRVASITPPELADLVARVAAGEGRP